MFDIITVVGFAITIAGIGLQVVSEFVPKEKKPKYYLAVLILSVGITIIYLGKLSTLIEFYTLNIKIITPIILVLLIVTSVISLRTYAVYQKFRTQQKEKILAKEFVKINPETPFIEITLDAKKDCGRFYFDGKCLLLPRGRYKVTPNPSHPGGWSTWDRDDRRWAKQQAGPWTWKALVSIPGVTADFDHEAYVFGDAFRECLQLGPIGRWWRYKDLSEIEKSLFVQNEFPITIEFNLERVSPVWFWLYDDVPQDNRGEIHLYLYRIG